MKIFPRTFDGDQIRIVFDTDEEQRAFKEVVESLLEFFAERREDKIVTHKFKTTLHSQVAKDYLSEVMKVAGLHVMNNYVEESTWSILPKPFPQNL